MQNFDDLFTAPSTPEEDKPAWIAHKQQEREAVYAQIDEAISTMASDGPRFQTYLDVQARFDRYSVANAVLIASQMPEATRLGDFDAWKASGAYVKRGAIGLSILEPGKEYRREDGSVGVSYNVKKVFDISQTNAQRPAQKTHPEDRQLLRALLNDPPCKIEVTAEVPDGRKVAYIPDEKNGAILVRQGLDAHTILPGVGTGTVQSTPGQEWPPKRQPGFCRLCCLLSPLPAEWGPGGQFFLSANACGLQRDGPPGPSEGTGYHPGGGGGCYRKHEPVF